jgi:filamentous hemagglutinin
LRILPGVPLLDLLTGSRTLTGGDLTLSGITLTTADKAQGQNVSVSARDGNRSTFIIAWWSTDPRW